MEDSVAQVCEVGSFQNGRCFTRRWPSTNKGGSAFSGNWHWVSSLWCLLCSWRCTDSLNALSCNRCGAMRRNLLGNSSKSAAHLSPDVLSPYCNAHFDKHVRHLGNSTSFGFTLAAVHHGLFGSNGMTQFLTILSGWCRRCIRWCGKLSLRFWQKVLKEYDDALDASKEDALQEFWCRVVCYGSNYLLE